MLRFPVTITFSWGHLQGRHTTHSLREIPKSQSLGVQVSEWRIALHLYARRYVQVWGQYVQVWGHYVRVWRRYVQVWRQYVQVWGQYVQVWRRYVQVLGNGYTGHLLTHWGDVRGIIGGMLTNKQTNNENAWQTRAANACSVSFPI